MAKRVQVKPGKTASRIGMFAGLAMVVLGCTVIIPIFGIFGIVWTGIAALITFSHFRNGFTEEGIVTHEITVEDTEEEDIEAKLKKLASLYNQGLISEDEYLEKRQELLDRF